MTDSKPTTDATSVGSPLPTTEAHFTCACPRATEVIARTRPDATTPMEHPTRVPVPDCPYCHARMTYVGFSNVGDDGDDQDG